MKIIKGICKILLNLKKQTDMKDFIVKGLPTVWARIVCGNRTKRGICIEPGNKLPQFLKICIYAHAQSAGIDRSKS